MDHEAREPGAITRGQNVIYVMPHDWASTARFLEPVIERIDESRVELQALVIAADGDSAAAIAAATVRVIGDRPLQVIAATSPARAARLLKIRPAHIVVGTPSTIVALMRSASVKLETVRQVCAAWLDELLMQGEGAALEMLMVDMPKDSARIMVVGETSAAVEEMLERYARRARRVTTAASEGVAPTPVEYVTTSSNARLSVLRRVLDAIDPTSAIVFARDDESVRAVNDLLRSMGYAKDDAVRVATVAAPETGLSVLFDLPATREELREAAGGAARAIALIQPRQLTSLRALAAGGAIRALTLPESSQRAHAGDEAVRRDLRGALDENRFGRALLAIEPLLDDFDGAEIAAAALTLLEREREAHRAALASIPATQREAGPMVRLFVTIGSRDGARAGDLVGAMANQGGVSSAEIGKVDVRESHSVVEVSAGVADAIIERVNGTTIKGRRAVVRRDEQPDRERGGRGGDRGDRGDRGPRGPRMARDGERGDRSGRGAPRGDRPRPSRGDTERRPRAPRRGDNE